MFPKSQLEKYVFYFCCQSEDLDAEPTGEGASVDEAAAQSADDSSQTDTVDGADSNMTPEEANEKKYVQKREWVNIRCFCGADRLYTSTPILQGPIIYIRTCPVL